MSGKAFERGRATEKRKAGSEASEKAGAGTPAFTDIRVAASELVKEGEGENENNNDDFFKETEELGL